MISINIFNTTECDRQVVLTSVEFSKKRRSHQEQHRSHVHGCPTPSESVVQSQWEVGDDVGGCWVLAHTPSQLSSRGSSSQAMT